MQHGHALTVTDGVPGGTASVYAIVLGANLGARVLPAPTISFHESIKNRTNTESQERRGDAQGLLPDGDREVFERRIGRRRW